MVGSVSVMATRLFATSPRLSVSAALMSASRRIQLNSVDVYLNVLRYALLPMLLLLSWGSLPGIAQNQTEELIDYVVQSICVDDKGKPTRALPIENDCTESRLQRSDDIATYRKHDWPNTLNDPKVVGGYQASDSVLERRASRMLVVQTFDFGTDDRVFGRFDGGRGDGGQVLLFVGDWASFAMTEDGSGGVQWFIGETCRSPVDQDARFLSWLVFSKGVREGRWLGVVAKLNITGNPNVCPSRFSDAFTRYRMDRVEFPFRIIEGPFSVTLARRNLQVIVSEHYGGSNIATADHLERFYFAKSLGLVRWERWANGNLQQPQSARAAQRMLSQTARCPPIDQYGPPTQSWLLVDCRTWTSLVRQEEPWSVMDYRWNAVERLGEIS
jgi:hypothetical protein